jgi:hypothetical protein
MLNVAGRFWRGKAFNVDLGWRVWGAEWQSNMNQCKLETNEQIVDKTTKKPKTTVERRISLFHNVRLSLCWSGPLLFSLHGNLLMKTEKFQEGHHIN